jgi:hypothetical protein
MKKSVKLIPFIVLIILLAVAVVPVSAARPSPAVGTQINILSGGDRDIDAGVPFNISQGWGIDSNKHLGTYRFTLEIAGVSLRHPLHYIDRVGLLNLYVYNFPEGLSSGTYAYIGRWFAPCGEFFDPATCTNPKQIIEIYSTTGNLNVTPAP